jgi:hypothetical protein
MTAAPTSRPLAGALATVANFPLVFLGILAIATQSSGDQEIALLNLWAIWGFLQALLGQVGLATAVLDRMAWNAPPILARAAGAGVLTIAIVAPLRSRLFPGHERWVLAAGAAAFAVFLIGRLRGDRSLAGDGVSTVVVTAAENLLRTALLLVLLLADRGSIADLAIVAPFLLSIVALEQRRHRRPAGAPGNDAASSPARVWGGVLVGLPAVAAYALVPGLTLLDEVADLDAVSIATSLLRGPLLVATFASAWILQEFLDGAAPPKWLQLLFPPLVGAHLVVQLFDPGLIVGLVLHGLVSGVALFLGYLATLGSLHAVDRLNARAGVGVAAAVAVFVVLLMLSPSVGLVHPFLALTGVAGVLGAVLATATSPEVTP